MFGKKMDDRLDENDDSASNQTQGPVEQAVTGFERYKEDQEVSLRQT